ncbi:hypothetical protein SeMB42_g04528, partial [Synchytrium endobioticum]
MNMLEYEDMTIGNHELSPIYRTGEVRVDLCNGGTK